MSDDAGLTDFKHGIEFLRQGKPVQAAECFRQATEHKQQNPYYISFLGVSMARSQGQWGAAVELCKTAVSLKRNDVQLYLNLAEAYMSAGRRDIAVHTLDTASRYCGADRRIARMRSKLGKRRPPVLSFLPRTSFVNRGLGMLRHRLSPRVQPAPTRTDLCA